MSPREAMHEFQETMSRYCAGALSAEELSRFDEQLKTHSVLRQNYWEYMEVHAEMVRMAAGESVPRLDFDQLFETVVLEPKRGVLVLTACSLAVLASVCLVGFVGWQLVRTPPRSVVVVQASSKDLTLAEGAAALVNGQTLVEGQQVTLRSGLLTLQTFEGTLLDLQGPCQVRLNSEQGVYLTGGSLRAYVPESAAGFTVTTPNAIVIDHGTEFIVHYDASRGTDVSVREGLVEAMLSGEEGERRRRQVVEGQSFTLDLGEILESRGTTTSFASFDRQRGGVQRLDGASRLSVPDNLVSMGQLKTLDHVLVIPEAQGLMIEQETTIRGHERDFQIPAGAKVSSYLIHFDPGDYATKAPNGTIEFNGTILGVIVGSGELAATDGRFSGADGQHFQDDYRGLEMDEAGGDRVEVSADRRSVHYHFNMTVPHFFDECRVIVRED